MQIYQLPRSPRPQAGGPRQVSKASGIARHAPKSWQLSALPAQASGSRSCRTVSQARSAGVGGMVPAWWPQKSAGPASNPFNAQLETGTESFQRRGTESARETPMEPIGAPPIARCCRWHGPWQRRGAA